MGESHQASKSPRTGTFLLIINYYSDHLNGDARVDIFLTLGLIWNLSKQSRVNLQLNYDLLVMGLLANQSVLVRKTVSKPLQEGLWLLPAQKTDS